METLIVMFKTVLPENMSSKASISLENACTFVNI